MSSYESVLNSRVLTWIVGKICQLCFFTIMGDGHMIFILSSVHVINCIYSHQEI